MCDNLALETINGQSIEFNGSIPHFERIYCKFKKIFSEFSYCNIKNFVHSLKITIKNACEKSKLTRIIFLNTKDKKKFQLN